MANEEEALVDDVENGEIVTEETPSRKQKQSKGLISDSLSRSILRKSSRVIHIISR